MADQPPQRSVTCRVECFLTGFTGTFSRPGLIDEQHPTLHGFNVFGDEGPLKNGLGISVKKKNGRPLVRCPPVQTMNAVAVGTVDPDLFGSMNVLRQLSARIKNDRVIEKHSD